MSTIKMLVPSEWIVIDTYGTSVICTYNSDMSWIDPSDLSKIASSSSSSQIILRHDSVLIAIRLIKCIIGQASACLPNQASSQPFQDAICRRVEYRASLNAAFDFQSIVLDSILDLIHMELLSAVQDIEKIAYNALDVLSRSVTVQNLSKLQALKSRENYVMLQVKEIHDLLGQATEDATANHITTVMSQYLEKLHQSLTSLRNLEDNITETEDFINIKLNSQSNQLAALNMLMNTGQFAMSIIAAVSGIMGMNLDNVNWGPSVANGFVGFTVSSIVVACAVFVIIIVYCRKARLLQ